MAFTGKAVLPILILVLGLIAATIELRKRGRFVSQTNIVPMPLIGGSEGLREGPWPQCIGKTGDECKKLIRTYAEDVTVYIVPQDSMVTMDFRTDRVRIFVDDDNVVTKTPSRG